MKFAVRLYSRILAGGRQLQNSHLRLQKSHCRPHRQNRRPTETVKEFNKANPERQIKGFGEVKCLELAAAFELGRRRQRLSPGDLRERRINGAEDAYALFRSCFAVDDEQENAFVLALDADRRPICEPFLVSRGTANATLMHPREVFKQALRWGAHSIYLAHNHPSGIQIRDRRTWSGHGSSPKSPYSWTSSSETTLPSATPRRTAARASYRSACSGRTCLAKQRRLGARRGPIRHSTIGDRHPRNDSSVCPTRGLLWCQTPSAFCILRLWCGHVSIII